jgi:hypothetical protein
MSIHDDRVSLIDQFRVLTKDLDMDTHRVALSLSTTMGDKYFVADIVEEWENAIRFLPEGDDATQPMLVFKNCIEALRVMSRPQKRRKENHEPTPSYTTRAQDRA